MVRTRWSRPGRSHRWTGALLLVVALVAWDAGAAQGHASLVASNPSADTTLSELPDEVTLTFGENVAEPAFVSVAGPEGRNLADGEPQVLNSTVTQPIENSFTNGRYTIYYRVVSADSHPVGGKVSFTLAASGAQQASGPATSGITSGTTSDDDSGSGTALVLMLAILLALGVAVAFALARGSLLTSSPRSGRPQPDADASS